MMMMMMAQKKHFLHELLTEDQEPFLLTSYISEKQSLLNKKRPNSPNTTLQLKKQKPIQRQTPTFFPVNLCKNACFNATTTPDVTKSPLFHLSSPRKSPCSSPNTIFLHVPARTASILLEAALRIQRHSKTKTHNKSNGFGQLGSLFKRLTQRGRNNKKRQIEGKKETTTTNNNNNNKNSSNVKKVKDILMFELDSYSAGRRRTGEEEENKKKGNDEVGVSCEVGFRCSCSAVWSESNEDNKSMDMGTSSSARSCCDFEEEVHHLFVAKEKENNAHCGACFVDDDNVSNCFFCESPFRFVLQRSPSSSSGHRTPEFSSPASSPSRRRTEDKESNNGADSINKFQAGEEEEEEKEQCSPVSVLDPPFEDDDDDVHENDDEGDGFDLECSYANAQRTRQQLLYRLRRFEKLAELDPLELEKRMLDQEDDEFGAFIEEEDGCEDGDSETSCEEKDLREIVYAIVSQPSAHDRGQVPEDLKRLVSDLIMEEEITELNSSEDRDIVITRVCRRLELWKEVDSNTIDMMIDEDFSREEGGWVKNAQQVRELAGELELAIFGFLVEEFSEELGS